MGVALYIAGDYEFFEFVPPDIKREVYDAIHRATGIPPTKSNNEYFTYSGYISNVDTEDLEKQIEKLKDQYSAAFREFNFDYYVLHEPDYTIHTTIEVTEPDKVAQLIITEVEDDIHFYGEVVYGKIDKIPLEYRVRLRNKVNTAIRVLKGSASEKSLCKLRELKDKLL